MVIIAISLFIAYSFSLLCLLSSSVRISANRELPSSEYLASDSSVSVFIAAGGVGEGSEGRRGWLDGDGDYRTACDRRRGEARAAVGAHGWDGAAAARQTAGQCRRREKEKEKKTITVRATNPRSQKKRSWVNMNMQRE